MRITGNESFMTIFHSAIERAQMLKIIGIGSTTMIIMCKPNERTIAPTNHIFLHGGMTKSDWFSETEFNAFNISITTRTDRAIVIGWGSWIQRTLWSHFKWLNFSVTVSIESLYYRKNQRHPGRIPKSISFSTWKIEQSMPANFSGVVVHCIWLVNCHHDISGPFSA